MWVEGRERWWWMSVRLCGGWGVRGGRGRHGGLRRLRSKWVQRTAGHRRAPFRIPQHAHTDTQTHTLPDGWLEGRRRERDREKERLGVVCVCVCGERPPHPPESVIFEREVGWNYGPPVEAVFIITYCSCDSELYLFLLFPKCYQRAGICQQHHVESQHTLKLISCVCGFDLSFDAFGA